MIVINCTLSSNNIAQTLIVMIPKEPISSIAISVKGGYIFSFDSF